jgi:hypothetical protein
MFDLGRALAIGWLVLVIVRTRTWRAALPLALAAYLFALGIASGITIRSEGPQEPMMSLLLILIGPTAMPRGHLPALPLVTLAVRWPVVADVVAGAALIIPAWRFMVRSDALPATSEEGDKLGRIALALSIVAGFDGLSAGTRAVPYLLDWSAGGQIFGDLPR